ncbi:phosphoglycerate mutase [Oxalobacteraceae bacterium CAVE-383]|nr:phosphoglycerate mutase [Oxalobacteraceae bacterium CAVE-383]
MHVYLIRHPLPLVEAGVCYGHTDLTCAPEQQAATLRDALPLLPPSLAGIPVISSPLRRCADLALALPGAAVTFDARLKEMHFGAWEMQRWDAIARGEIDAWAENLLHYRPGDGENVMQLTRRVHDFYLSLLERDDPHLVVVAHSGSMRVLAACAPDRSVEQIAALVKGTPSPKYGEVVVWQPKNIIAKKQ